MKKPSRAHRKTAKARLGRPSKIGHRRTRKSGASRSLEAQQMAAWLEKLGMSGYAELFAQNDIDISVLPHLTDADLEKIGVSLGHRRKMLAAVGQLAAAAPEAPEATALIEPKPHDAAERRQVTVMFSDLVGSTVLASRMDPEDLREVIWAYQKSVAEAVQQFGGFLSEVFGGRCVGLNRA